MLTYALLMQVRRDSLTLAQHLLLEAEEVDNDSDKEGRIGDGVQGCKMKEEGEEGIGEEGGSGEEGGRWEDAEMGEEGRRGEEGGSGEEGGREEEALHACIPASSGEEFRSRALDLYSIEV